MKYKALLLKLTTRGNQLVKNKKELVPLVVKLTQKSFNELQEDMIINYRDLLPDEQLQATDNPSIFTIKHSSVGIGGTISIE